MKAKTKENLDFADRNETGKIGVIYLKYFWSKAMLERVGQASGKTQAEWNTDKILLSGLGLALEETIQHLYINSPTFEEFENWILEINGGEIDSIQIERLNAALCGENNTGNVKEWLESIENQDSVLSDEDLDFWKENGYVIVRRAISEDDARETEKAVWEYLEMNPKDSDSWYDRTKMQGIMIQAFYNQAFQTNRKSKRVHKVFSQIWKTADLWTSIDRVGFNPPEKTGIYEFPGPNLHWDLNFENPQEFGVQGVLYLTDVSAKQGAFTCVPGFHRKLKNWLEKLPPEADPNAQNLESLGAKPIVANAGDLIIWHQALPHGSSPNRAEYPRIVQYISMFPK